MITITQTKSSIISRNEARKVTYFRGMYWVVRTNHVQVMLRSNVSETYAYDSRHTFIYQNQSTAPVSEFHYHDSGMHRLATPDILRAAADLLPATPEVAPF